MAFNMILVWVIGTAVLFKLVSSNYKNCSLRIPISYGLLCYLFLTFLLSQNYFKNYADKIRENYLLIFVLALLSLLATIFSPINSIQKTLFFAIFVTLMTITLSPLYLIADKLNIALPIFITVISLFSILSISAYVFPNRISYKLGNIAFWSLLGLILFRIAIFFTNSRITSQLVKISSYIGIIIFSVFILYDTKNLIRRAKLCSKDFDYINNLLSLFLDFVNMFADMTTLGIMKN